MTNEQKNAAVFGVLITLTINPTDTELADPNFKPRTEEIRVRPMQIKDYDAATNHLDAESDIDFTAVAVGRDKKWIETLTGESYELLAAAVQEVNAQGFFVSYGRRIGRRLVLDQVRRQNVIGTPSQTPGK